MRYSRWDQIFSERDTNDILLELAHRHYESLSERTQTERRGILASFTSNDIRYLCDLDLANKEYTSSDLYHLSQIRAFFKKREDLDFGIDRKGAALEKFKWSESECRKTNAIFKSWSSGKFQFTPTVEHILHAAQLKISKLLGDVPSLSDLKLRFGPGATTKVKKSQSHPVVKLHGGLQCSESLVRMLPDLLGEMPGWRDSILIENRLPVSIESGVIAYARKDFEEDRLVIKQPVLNTVVQAGYGDFLKDILRSVGVDLYNGSSYNQELARIGSLTGDLATLDLKSASDTVARELIYHLFPIDWAMSLECACARQVEVDGSMITLEKFSSQGNGFTFPLETIVFWALTHSTYEVIFKKRLRRDEWTIYGDDIICPSILAPFINDVLRICGFTVNLKKSFWEGPFRESCGKDFLSGTDVRPCFVKERLSFAGLFVLHNYYARRGLVEFQSAILDKIPSHLRLFGPDGYGDGHLISDVSSKRRHFGKGHTIPYKKDPFDIPSDWRSSRYQNGLGGYLFDTFIQIPVKKFYKLNCKTGDGVYPSYAIYMSEESRLASRPKGLDDFCELSSLNCIHDEDSYLQVVLPGAKGYKRISVYTLNG